MNRSDPPLRWMSYEAAAAGLRLLPFEREWKIKPEISIHESLTGPWKVLEWLPVNHLTYGDKNTAKRRCVIYCELHSRTVHSTSLPGGTEAKVVTLSLARSSIALSFVVQSHPITTTSQKPYSRKQTLAGFKSATVA